MNLAFPGKRHTCGTSCQWPGCCQGYAVAGWPLLIFGAPHCQLILVSDSSPKLSKCLRWMDDNINGLLDQASSFWETIWIQGGVSKGTYHVSIVFFHSEQPSKATLSNLWSLKLLYTNAPFQTHDIFFVPWYKIIPLLKLYKISDLITCFLPIFCGDSFSKGFSVGLTVCSCDSQQQSFH